MRGQKIDEGNFSNDFPQHVNISSIPCLPSTACAEASECPVRPAPSQPYSFTPFLPNLNV